MQELQKYLWDKDPIYAIGGTIIFLLVTFIVKSKLKEVNGANLRMHEEIERLEKKINGIAKCMNVLKEIVYKLEGRLSDD